MTPETKKKVELNYLWARHTTCLERGDEKMAKFWLDRFNKVGEAKKD